MRAGAQGAVSVLLGTALACAPVSGPERVVPEPPETAIEETEGPAASPAGWLGHYLDDQASELSRVPGAEVERRTDAIIAQWRAEELFDPGGDHLMPSAPGRLRQLAAVLNAYPQSHVIVRGHEAPASDDGIDPQALSQQRASRIRDFLRSAGVHPSRLTAIGFGAGVPLVSSTTESGRARNRRIEIEIRPHDEVFR